MLYYTQRMKQGISGFNSSLYMQIKCCILSQVNSASIYNNGNLLLGFLNKNSPYVARAPLHELFHFSFSMFSLSDCLREFEGGEGDGEKARTRNNCWDYSTGWLDDILSLFFMGRTIAVLKIKRMFKCFVDLKPEYSKLYLISPSRPGPKPI